MKLKHEIIHSIAGLKKTPIFVFTLVFTLAITLGALFAAFNLNQLILFKELPYANAEQLYILEQNKFRDGKDNIGSQIIGAQIRMHRLSKEFISSAIINSGSGILVSSPSEPVISTLFLSNELFSLLSIPFELGGAFSQSDDKAPLSEAKAEAVISYQLWQTDFAGSKQVIGQSMQVNDEQYKIVGVIAQGFKEPDTFTSYASQVYLPFKYSGLNESIGRGTSSLLSLVRLSDGQSLAGVAEQLSMILKDFTQEGVDTTNYEDTELKAHLTKLSESIQGDSAQITLVIFAASLVLLLIAFANVVNLYLSHISKKQQLLAICACIGAKPKAIFKKLFVESLLLTISAAIFALVIAAWLLVLTREIAGEALPRLNELSLDSTTIIFSLIISVVLAALLAFFGKFAVSYDALKEQLSASGKGTNAQVSPKIRKMLIASQVSLTGLLLLVTSMVLQTNLETVNKPLGINVDNVTSVWIDAGKNYQGTQQLTTLARQLKQHFSQLPQVDSVAITTSAPILKWPWGMAYYDKNNKRLGSFRFNTIDESYIDTLQLSLLSGRNFSLEEITEQKNVIILSKASALKIFNKVDVAGQYIYNSNGKANLIIGVTENYIGNLSEESRPQLYLPARPWWRLTLNLKIKPNMPMSKIALLEQLRIVDKSLRIQDYLPLAQAAQAMFYQYRLTAWLAAGLSLFALILACTGIYGVISYSTQMRRYELGVRMALGAKRKRIINLVLKDALKPVMLGLCASLLFAVLIYQVAMNQIEHLGSPDAIQIILSLLLLLGFSFIACFIPVKSMVKQDPVKALRDE
ncbi:MAG: ABC transporter permease [Colwellia sp.]|nr:ABC transporter permease [Colwellia sp.]